MMMQVFSNGEKRLNRAIVMEFECAYEMENETEQRKPKKALRAYASY